MSTPVTFQIEDLYGEPIKGGWYARQLIKIKPADDEFDNDDLTPPRAPPRTPAETILRDRYDLRTTARPARPVVQRQYPLRNRR